MVMIPRRGSRVPAFARLAPAGERRAEKFVRQRNVRRTVIQSNRIPNNSRADILRGPPMRLLVDLAT